MEVDVKKNDQSPNPKNDKTEMPLAASVIKDLPYANQSNAQKLDIYLPAKGVKPYPVIVWIHPGGFFEGDKSGGGAADPLAMINMKVLVPPILARGYAVVAINYRLSHEAQFPSDIFDVKAAIRWVRGNASKYGFNPKKVASWGSSAGGHLSSFLAVSEGVKELEDLSMGNPAQSSGVIAAVDWYGNIDHLTMDPQTIRLGFELWGGGHNAPDSPESKLMGEQITKIPERCKASCPVTYAKVTHAPIYIQHGKADNIVPYLQSVQLVDKLKSVGGPNEVIFETFEKAGHADPVFFTKENINRMLDFLDKYMK
jgi:acetyl esterase/lipase